eukprot:1138389-Amphidinium_carterae.1
MPGWTQQHGTFECRSSVSKQVKGTQTLLARHRILDGNIALFLRMSSFCVAFHCARVDSGRLLSLKEPPESHKRLAQCCKAPYLCCLYTPVQSASS